MTSLRLCIGVAILDYRGGATRFEPETKWAQPMLNSRSSVFKER